MNITVILNGWMTVFASVSNDTSVISRHWKREKVKLPYSQEFTSKLVNVFRIIPDFMILRLIVLINDAIKYVKSNL